MSQTDIIKVGTNSLEIPGAFEIIAKEVDGLYSRGINPVLVSSGAVAAGMKLLGITERPTDIQELQDLSAEGARPLSNFYASTLLPYGIGIWYIPVTELDFKNGSRSYSLRRRVERAWGKRKLPIFNNNDALSGDELGLSDNDSLLVRIAYCVGANVAVIVSDDGKMGTGGGMSKSKALTDLRKGGIDARIGKLSDLGTLLL